MTLPPLRPGKVPAFHELGDDTFEDLCQALIQEEDDVTSAKRYGTRGQRQLGVDVLIEFKDGSHGAGQCKSHQSCDEALIKRACDEFLTHAAHWQEKGVRTFILFLAADTRRTQWHDERLTQHARLAQHGFSLQVWSGTDLTAKLRKQRHIVRHFLPLSETYICGPSVQLDIQSEFQQATIAALAKQLGEVAEGDHAELRELWRDGRLQEALSRLRALKGDTLTWAVLPSATKAKLLRLQGRMLLTFGDVATAISLATEADQLDGSDPDGPDPGRARLLKLQRRLDSRLRNHLRRFPVQYQLKKRSLQQRRARARASNG